MLPQTILQFLIQTECSFRIPGNILHINGGMAACSFIYDVNRRLTEDDYRRLENTLNINIVQFDRCHLSISDVYSKHRCIERCSAIGRELIECAWHPRRIMEWCLDNEDKADN